MMMTQETRETILMLRFNQKQTVVWKNDLMAANQGEFIKACLFRSFFGSIFARLSLFPQGSGQSTCPLRFRRESQKDFCFCGLLYFLQFKLLEYVSMPRLEDCVLSPHIALVTYLIVNMCPLLFVFHPYLSSLPSQAVNPTGQGLYFMQLGWSEILQIQGLMSYDYGKISQKAKSFSLICHISTVI